MISALLAAALLLTEAAPGVAPASHADTTASDTVKPARAAADDKAPAKDAKAGKEVRVCHLEEISGSRIPKKICD